MASKRLALLAVTILAGCGGGSRDSIAADSLSRDLQLMPVDSSAVLDDRPAEPPKPVATKPAAPKPRPKPAPAPAPGPAPAPLLLASGTVIPTAVDQEINSRVN
jgi:endoglucanase